MNRQEKLCLCLFIIGSSLIWQFPRGSSDQIFTLALMLFFFFGFVAGDRREPPQ